MKRLEILRLVNSAESILLREQCMYACLPACLSVCLSAGRLISTAGGREL